MNRNLDKIKPWPIDTGAVGKRQGAVDEKCIFKCFIGKFRIYIYKEK